ncbi:hypothetical protein NQ314_010846 [Rhamnusium bicolor]|uniref:Uncharacterized protein n=1 Tax=Rhamnusium bicolor TaxID=1586634 RepID=A0AAV8XN48_9CUCU|nr:hypothetical protein NQ314_010846 [Rhamnusium bicolor]
MFMAFLYSIFSKRNKMLSSNHGSLSFTRLDHGRIDPSSHKVNNLEKRFLVWTGKYKTVEEVPSFVSQSVVERARNRMRIRIANYMMLAAAVGCVIMIYSGKKAAERGESVQKQNIEWHKQLKEQKN